MVTRIRLARRFVFVLLTALQALAACGSQPAISTATDYCCRSGAANVSSYRVEFRDMPEFLKPMLRDEFSIALANKGLEYTEGEAHSVLTMTFVATPLTAQGDDARFNAEIHVELTNSVTRELVWSGSLSREHFVTEESYMHEAPARAAMKNALRNLFADYPGPDSQEYR